MRIERNHSLGQQEAIRRLDTFLDTLIESPLPAGLRIEAPSKIWSGNVMNFSFRAKKGWLGTTIAGSIVVTDQSMVFDSDLPALVRTFVSEEDIRALINQKLDGLLHA